MKDGYYNTASIALLSLNQYLFASPVGEADDVDATLWSFSLAADTANLSAGNFRICDGLGFMTIPASYPVADSVVVTTDNSTISVEQKRCAKGIGTPREEFMFMSFVAIPT